ncbi:MAG: DUF5682 family protein, partial [Gammaproteobacteria bacterium]
MDNRPHAPALWHTAEALYFVPIRHHSPACAQHLRRLITEVSPAAILIEGPCDFDALSHLVTAADTKPPVAIAVFPARGSAKRPATKLLEGVVSYYPLCAHSPEYVALEEAAARGIVARFIDLPSSHRIMQLAEVETGGGHALSLTDERAFDSSDYVSALCARTGCRDQNELWDHLFETRVGDPDWRLFFRDVGAYCQHVRSATAEEGLRSDGTFEREAQMAALVREIKAATVGPVVVVTGGFHTGALIESLQSATKPIKPKAAGEKTEAYLIRYGFEQLDRLNGYAAGMPAPAYYDRLWQTLGALSPGDSPWQALSLTVLTEFAASLRATRPSLVPPVSALAGALEAAVRLADLRQRPGPTREDLLDACRASLLEGEEVRDGAPIMQLLHDFMTGHRIGNVPPSAGSPPLVEATRCLARKLGFSVEDGQSRNRELDVYRKPRHREASRFLHAMSLLETGFASKTGGPDFLSGVKLDLLFESWRYSWSPMVEARLIELAPGAETVPDACLRELRRRAAALEQLGEGRSARLAVELLLEGCQAGLAERALELLPLIQSEITQDPELPGVVDALRTLFLVWRGREIIGLVGAGSVERLLGTAYERALFLLPDIVDVAEDRVAPLLQALATLREVVSTAASQTDAIDESLFSETVTGLLEKPLHPALEGSLAALGFLAGTLGGAALVGRFRGALGGAYANTAERVAFLRGVVAISRELLWRLPDLMDAADETLAGLEEDDFIALLPDLRLAFAELDPRETDRLARQIAGRHGVSALSLSGQVSYAASAGEVQRNLELSA